MFSKRGIDSEHPSWQNHVDRLAETAKDPRLSDGIREELGRYLDFARRNEFSPPSHCLRLAAVRLRLQEALHEIY
jgi:hypothetical protein